MMFSLVADMTSEFLSREIDVSQFGIIFAGLQKFGARRPCLGNNSRRSAEPCTPETPMLLNYKVYENNTHLRIPTTHLQFT